MYLYDNYYTAIEVVKTAWSLFVTRLFYRGAFLIRQPFYLRGRPRVAWGRGFRTGYRCRLEAFGERNDRETRLSIGESCHMGDNVHIAAAEKVAIGNNCLIASHVFISDCSHGDTANQSPSVQPASRPLVTKPTSIGDNVWIGENACILMGSRVGTGSIVGANAVVTKAFPDYCILAGAPAKIIKRYNFDTCSWEKIPTDLLS